MTMGNGIWSLAGAWLLLILIREIRKETQEIVIRRRSGFLHWDDFFRMVLLLAIPPGLYQCYLLISFMNLYISSGFQVKAGAGWIIFSVLVGFVAALLAVTLALTELASYWQLFTPTAAGRHKEEAKRFTGWECTKNGAKFLDNVELVPKNVPGKIVYILGHRTRRNLQIASTDFGEVVADLTIAATEEGKDFEKLADALEVAVRESGPRFFAQALIHPQVALYALADEIADELHAEHPLLRFALSFDLVPSVKNQNIHRERVPF